MDNGMRRLQAESIPIFSEGIGLVLYRWSALRMAVEKGWGGRESRFKADQLAADLLSWFTQQSREKLDIDDLEDMLEEGMISLNVQVDDGSIEEVAKHLMVIHKECLDGNFSSIEVLREASRQQSAHPHVTQIVNDDDDDDEDDEEEDGDNDENVVGNDNSSNMNVDIPISESNVNLVNRPVNGPLPTVASEADDGWIAVSHRRNKGRRN